MSTPEALQGQVGLVTGGSRGIGWAICEAMVSAGAHVWVNARQDNGLQVACEKLTESGPGRAQPVYFDVQDTRAIKAGVDTVFKANGRLNILVNNAGVMRTASIEMATQELIDDTLATNVRGSLACSQLAVRLMARAGGGSIINVASILGRVGGPGQAVYSASKAALIGATLSLAKELAGRQIRVNAIAPGLIETELLGSLTPEKREAAVASIAMGRIGTPQDVAPLCVFLASNQARYITGQVIGVDGGFSP